jgi:molecular chaperone GrpE
MTDEQTPADDGIDPAEGAEPTLEELQAQVAEWRDKALRAVAEAENVRRRTEREANDARAFAIQRFAKDLFGAADSLERALAAAPRETAEAAVDNFVLGIEMTEKALRMAFEGNGLKRLDPQPGEKFDPHLHQAMMEQEAEGAEPGSVVQTMQPGYELFGRVVRPAMVVVAARRAGAGADSGAAKTYADAGGQDAGGAVDTKA